MKRKITNYGKSVREKLLNLKKLPAMNICIY